MNVKIAKSAIIHEGVTFGDNVIVDEQAIIYPGVKIGSNVYIGPRCIIGEHTADFYTNKNHIPKQTIIGDNSILRSNTVIYEDVTIDECFQTGHNVTIREETIIGKHCSVGTLSDLQGKLKMGDYVRLHSNVHVGQLTVFESYIWIYPYVVFTNDPYPPMGNLVGSTVKSFAQIATGSIILPGKTIGENSFVAAKSLITKDVGANRLVRGNPGKDVCSVEELRDKDDKPFLPWQEHLKEYRGYPWQENPEEENNKSRGL